VSGNSDVGWLIICLLGSNLCGYCVGFGGMKKEVEGAFAANMIVNHIAVCAKKYGHCSVMLTGGRSAEKLYLAMAQLQSFWMLRNITFWFGDERCVSPDHPMSNYAMAMRTLFASGIPIACEIFRMEAEQDMNSHVYETQLPPNIDILLLSMGEDGHIASLFPHSPALHEKKRKVVPVIGPKPPFRRHTITPLVIDTAKQVFVLAIGEKKRAKYLEGLLDEENINALPARLVLNSRWIFDFDERTDLCPKL
jgi:6-phosphogluconolactonase